MSTDRFQWSDTVQIGQALFDLRHKDWILTLGSCFSDLIGYRLQQRKFKVLVNPAGILYNPISIETLLLYAKGQILWDESDAIHHGGVWYSFDHHGCISAHDLKTLKEKIGHLHGQLRNFLIKSDYLFVTLGSAHVYERKDNHKMVANCHKVPGTFFTKKMLTLEQSVASLANLIDTVKSMAPQCQIVFTLSPVRHIKDGHHQNQLSKATLLLSIEEVVRNREDVYYFPSYEIVLDELRDYCFFGKDKVHLTEEAADYVYDRFEDWCMNAETQVLAQRCLSIQKDLAHRPFYPDSSEYQEHLNRISIKIQNLQKEYPFLDFTSELTQLQGRSA